MRSRMCSFLLLTAVIAFPSQLARSEDFSKIRIVRLSFVEGDVQFQRPGQDWQDARLNLPIEEGFALRTANGYAEVEFEDALALRLGINSTVEFTDMSLQNGGGAPLALRSLKARRWSPQSCGEATPCLLSRETTH